MAGAFGAHALKDFLTENGMVENWKTASMYGLVHAALALVWSFIRPERRLSTLCWLSGVWLFSGSIFGLCLGGPSVLGPITPLGGLLLIVGWLSAAFSFHSLKSPNDE
ncbi:MAG: DUF423 domain-containing protein [Opitutales bacterium]